MGNVSNKPDRKDAPVASVMHSVSYVRLVLRSVKYYYLKDAIIG
jgi:hypothetical protein